MDFSFTSEQLQLCESIGKFLHESLTAEDIRSSWELSDGRCPTRWQQLTELGLAAVLVPEAYGGLGLSEVDFILLATECGFAGLPEPIVEYALVTLPLLAALAAQGVSEAEQLIESILAGTNHVAVAAPSDPFVNDAHSASQLLILNETGIYLVPQSQVTLELQPDVDPSARRYHLVWQPKEDYLCVPPEQSENLIQQAILRGSLGVSAQQLGAASKVLELAVAYCNEREQFGKPIGSFQAVKHLLANVAVQIEFAKPLLYRAAYDLARQDMNSLEQSALSVCQARISVDKAAWLAATNSLQVHGAMGYTWEMDLQIWLKRIWSLSNLWGSIGWHKARLAKALKQSQLRTGPGNLFANQ